jgi:hypothetical protein
MNELDFKRHLKDLAHGHHHTEEHDWDRQKPAANKPVKAAGGKRPTTPKSPKRK